MKTPRMAFVLAVALTCALFLQPASAHQSSGIVADRKGRIFFTDNGGDRRSLWRIDADGKLTRLHEGGWHWLALDDGGKYSAEDLKTWFEKRITMNFGRVAVPDTGGALLPADGAPVVVDRDGNICWAKGNLEIVRIARDGKVTAVAPKLKRRPRSSGASGAWRPARMGPFTSRVRVPS